MNDFPLARVADRLSDRHIRSMLRSATKAGILEGWQGPHTDQRSYCINPVNGDAQERSLEDVIYYCRLLAADGIKPLPAVTDEWYS